jgi:oligoendopeptidase F
VVDIYSRYLFEKEVFERRDAAELSADDFGEIMERAQKATYGDGLDERYLQTFMWTWKPHYYSPGLSFYNFPYAFGLLFATGLYAIYKQRGAAFVDDYRKLLAATGEAGGHAGKRFGIDIRTRKFWDDSLAIIGKRIDRFCEIQADDRTAPSNGHLRDRPRAAGHASRCRSAGAGVLRPRPGFHRNSEASRIGAPGRRLVQGG